MKIALICLFAISSITGLKANPFYPLEEVNNVTQIKIIIGTQKKIIITNFVEINYFVKSFSFKNKLHHFQSTMKRKHDISIEINTKDTNYKLFLWEVKGKLHYLNIEDNYFALPTDECLQMLSKYLN